MKRIAFTLLAIIIPAFIFSTPASAASPKARSMAQKLMLPPKPGLKRRLYSLEMIKRRHDVRRHLHGINIDTINFRFNSDIVGRRQEYKLGDIANAINIVLRRRPYEVFLIEGHADAVGSYSYNQHLSDRRAWNVLRVLNYRYGIPRRAMTAVGYGERYLKIRVPYEERRNRRVTVRNIAHILNRPAPIPRPRPRSRIRYKR